jgi:hypothetical protein
MDDGGRARADIGIQAVARNKGVDVIANEVSNRATP